MKKTAALILAVLMILPFFSSCGKAVPSVTAGAVKDEEFGNVYVDISIDDFNSSGFDFGDSVNISFSSGQTLTDIPYYSGYYTPVGEMLLCGYPGYPHPIIARNFGTPAWDEYGGDGTGTITVTLNEKGKYIDTQELFSLKYSDSRDDYSSDIEFANFRAVKGGSLRDDFFFRSASPCDNQHSRASYANRLAEENGIGFVLNLSDNEEKYLAHTQKDDFESEYYDSLYRSGKVLLLAMNANYRADAFAQSAAKGLYAMASQNSPCLIHCVEGKDRTGFVCALLLALAGASADEIIDDYFITFDNYYSVTKQDTPDRYEAVLGNFADFLYFICGAEKGTALDSLDLKTGAESYLAKGGLSPQQIADIESSITK